MKLNALALTVATTAVVGTSAFTPNVNSRHQTSSTALQNYARSKWSPRSSSSPGGSGGSGVSGVSVGGGGSGGSGGSWTSTAPYTTSTASYDAPPAAKSYSRTKWSPKSGNAATGGWSGGSFSANLSSSTASTTPTSSSPTSPTATTSPDSYDAIRTEIKSLLNNPSWDDGSLAPIFLRLAWHSSGTYDAATNTGGSNGAGMRFQQEANDPENAGLEVARAFLEPVKAKFPSISYSDLWILASYVGLEATGGPVIPFTGGRVDHADGSYWETQEMSYGRLPAAEKYCCPHLDDSNVSYSLDETGKVKGWEGLCSHVRNEVFYRMGFDDREIVALLCGGHVYGRCHPNFSGYAGPWVEHPTEFSNEYATDMIEDEWTLVSHGDTWLDAQGASELRPAPGKRQFVNKVHGKIDDDEPNQMMLLSDMILAWDPSFRQHLEVYAEDEERLKVDFGNAFKKLTELGCGF